MIFWFFTYDLAVLYDNSMIMERKTEHFFDGDRLNMDKVIAQLQQHPDKTKEILQYVMWKVEHFAEFHTKKEHLEEKYDRKMKDLYAEYMAE